VVCALKPEAEEERESWKGKEIILFIFCVE
jgi:hypothetical protein